MTKWPANDDVQRIGHKAGLPLTSDVMHERIIEHGY